MTLKTTRLVRNMIGIGGTVCAGTFAFSLVSSRSSIIGIHTLNGTYKDKLDIDPQTISTVNHIEDLEYSRGCKFLFYKDDGTKTKTFQEGNFKDARTSGVELPKLVDDVKKVAENCKNGSYVFLTS